MYEVNILDLLVDLHFICNRRECNHPISAPQLPEVFPSLLNDLILNEHDKFDI